MRYLLPLFLTALHVNAQNLGELYFNGNCVTCHHPTKTISAPSVVEFKQRYKDAFAKKEDFVSYMSKWVLKPTEEGSLMRDAIAKHAIMPELAFDKETLEIISGYIYDTDFTKKTGLEHWHR